MTNTDESFRRSTLVNRLRGIYTIPVDDGAGPLNGSDTFTREFTGLPAINEEAAKEIERLQSRVTELEAAIAEVFDVIDDKLGDTDPSVPDDFTDEDMRIEMPLLWCCRRLSFAMQ